MAGEDLFAFGRRERGLRRLLAEQFTAHDAENVRHLLRALAHVEEVASYETVLDEDGKEELIRLLENNEIDIVTFTSSSTVTNFLSLLEGKKTEKLLENVTLASIGPITSDTARDAGLKIGIEADEFTIPGLIDALLKAVDPS